MGERWILGDLRNAVNQLESALRVQPGSELNCLDTRFLAPLEMTTCSELPWCFLPNKLISTGGTNHV